MRSTAPRQIFISYQQGDKQVAADIAKGLESAGYTTWHYLRDSRAGTSHLVQTGKAIKQCQAVVLVISPKSIMSRHITTEVVRALEACNRFIPVLYGMTWEEFQNRQEEWLEEWRGILGATVGIEVPREGIASITPQLVAGLEAMGIPPAARASNVDGGDRSKRPSQTRETSGAPSPGPLVDPQRLVLLYKRNAHPDEEILELLETELTALGHHVFVDRHLRPGMEWAAEIERQVRAADAVIPLLSVASMGSEMLEEELQVAHENAQRTGKPRLFPVRVNYEGPLPDPLAAILNPIQYALWKSPQDDAKLVKELSAVLRNPPAPRPYKAEPDTGAVQLDSPFYIERPTDEQFRQAIARGDTVVLVKGARQMGKTSLLARGLQQAREAGSRVVMTDFQKLNADDLTTVERFYRALADLVADRLELDVSLEKLWNPQRAPNRNFERFVERAVLGSEPTPLVWGMDEVDRLFSCSFSMDVFGLFRAWFNDRSLNPTGPFKYLTMAIVYATEASLFITDLNQSPFNVGTVIRLEDFDIDQVGELNRRYDRPLRTDAELRRFFELLGGNPYFVRRGLQELRKPEMTFAKLESVADRDDGPFGDHLRRILVLLAKEPGLADVVRQVLRGQAAVAEESFLRLQSAGVMTGDSSKSVRPRCEVCATCLRRHLL